MQTKDNKTRSKHLIYDAILVLVLLVLGLSALLIFKSCAKVGTYVSVSVGGEVVGEYPLSLDAYYELNGGTNILVIKDGEAYMTEADCPDKKCINMGRVSRVGESISCRPNRVFITVK